MRFQRINRSDGDKVFVAGQNVSTETVTQGYALCLDTATYNGNRLTKPATANLNLFVGCYTGTASVQVNDYFEVQAYGANTSALVIKDTTAAGSIAVGDPLAPVNASWALKKIVSPGTGVSGLAVGAVAIATATNTSAVAGSVFLRAL